MSERTVRVRGVEFRVTTEHAASSYGQPVVVCPDGHGLVSGAQVAATAAAADGEEIPPGDERDG